MKLTTIAQCVASSFVLTGCFTIPAVDNDLSAERGRNKMEEMKASVGKSNPYGLRFVDSAWMGSRVISENEKKAWLTSKRVSLSPSRSQTLSARSIAVMLREEFGLNISSSLPLDSFNYSGLGVRDVDGETALRLLFTPMGLDYELNNENKYITIVPMKARTWTLSIGNRSTSYTSGQSNTNRNSGNGNPQNGSQQGQSGNTGNTGTGSQNSGNNTMSQNGSSGQNNQNSNGNNNEDNGSSRIQSQDTIWTSLREELEARLTIMMPVTSPATSVITASPSQGVNSPLPPDMSMVRTAPVGNAGTSVNSLFKEVKVGKPAINPETGAVTIQAPAWMLDSIGEYLDNTEASYNTSMTFEGHLLMLTTSKNRSEGMDVNAFIRWAGGKYGAVLKNTVLDGGVQISFPSGSLKPDVTTGSAQIAQTALGIVSPIDGLSIFNGYLESLGDVETLQKPIVNTTHGVPVEFEKETNEPYSLPNQEVAAGNTGAAVSATRNVLINESVGTKMRINPRYDAKTGLVRAQVLLNYSVKVGTTLVPTFISGANGTTTQVMTKIPRISKTKQFGEILARDGDLVILSGTIEDSKSLDNSGIPGLSNLPIFGKRGNNHNQVTYIFALRVKVDRKGLK